MLGAVGVRVGVLVVLLAYKFANKVAVAVDTEVTPLGRAALVNFAVLLSAEFATGAMAKFTSNCTVPPPPDPREAICWKLNPTALATVGRVLTNEWRPLMAAGLIGLVGGWQRPDVFHVIKGHAKADAPPTKPRLLVTTKRTSHLIAARSFF